MPFFTIFLLQNKNYCFSWYYSNFTQNCTILWAFFNFLRIFTDFFSLIFHCKYFLFYLITYIVVPTIPDLSECGEPTYYRRNEILKAYRNKYPTDAFIIYPDKKSYIGINAYDWLDDEKLYVYVSQEKELEEFTDFFKQKFSTK